MNQQLAGSVHNPRNSEVLDPGWKASPITISVTFHRNTEHPAPDGHDTRVYGELYNSPVFIDAHRELQESDPEPGYTLPCCIVASMFASDETTVTGFGDMKIWPWYMVYGNESKYRRSKPMEFCREHVAYFESLPDSFIDFATPIYVRLLLDEEFSMAYQHGIIIDCSDSVRRCFYPRIFTHSTDYPEKILLVGIRYLGQCPCPRCHIHESELHKMGMRRDMTARVSKTREDDEPRRHKVKKACKLIFEENYAVNSAVVEALLKPESLFPAANTFSDVLGPLGFNMFLVCVVDLMHDFELGVWKSLFEYILRILECVDECLLKEVDRG
ncbi:hypothetical protein OF83DRAFT_1165868 [Amylostereum chailletii]|nr:hypothetical protein OF83DRAFT_1165868 [Amylostereum chailletii]